MIDKAAWRTIRTASRAIVARELNLRIEGQEFLPVDGPVLLAARHYHHLYDGCALMATVPRQLQILVGLDWIERPIELSGMQAACRSAGWPVVFRNTDVIDRSIWLPRLRAAINQSVEILRDGRVLLVFPEGYPTIDPHGSPKANDDEILPFRPGVAQIALRAWKTGVPAALVPVGLHYAPGERERVQLRFGAPVSPCVEIRPGELADVLYRRVSELSRP